MKLVVFQIDVVDDLGNLAQTLALCQTELFQHRLESAVFSVVGELGSKHIERNRSFDRSPFSNEIKARPLIDELFNQPGRGQPVDVQIAARDPTLTLILCGVERARFSARRTGFCNRTL